MPGIILYDHQNAAVAKMHNGCILCGGVGSGKSRTALAYYWKQSGGKLNTKQYVYLKKRPKDLYIITTARKRDEKEWDDELIPFLLSRDTQKNPYANKVVIDSWNNIQKYSGVTNSFFIFDEQRVIGSGAWVKAFLKIAKVNEWVLLSATPGDSWMDYVPVFIANGFYKNRSEFIREHVIYKRFSKFPQIDRYCNTQCLYRYRQKVLVDMKLKRDTVQHHEDVYVTYDPKMYHQITKKRWDIWKDRPFKNAAELCFAQRKVVNSDESRQLALIELAEKHPRMIVFYNFDYELEILRGLYYGSGVVIAEWNGHKHQPIPKTKHWVYLVQYASGAEGWNCIETDTIVFYSQSYSYRVMIQSAGRIDRLNTPYRDLYYYHLRSRSGIDCAIARALRQRKDFNESRYAGRFEKGDSDGK